MVESEGRIHLNPDIARVVCSVTGSETEAKQFSRPLGLCGCCPPPGKPLVVVYELDTIRERLGDTGWGTDPGIWRYGALLPVLGLPPSYAPDVGLTQAVRSESLTRENGVDLYLKNEGSNPTGSFKDRGLAVGIALGVACGAKRFFRDAWYICRRTTGAASTIVRRSSSVPRCGSPAPISRPQERS